MLELAQSLFDARLEALPSLLVNVRFLTQSTQVLAGRRQYGRGIVGRQVRRSLEVGFDLLEAHRRGVAPGRKSPWLGTAGSGVKY